MQSKYADRSAAEEVERTEDLPVLQVEDPLLPFPEGDHWTYPVGVKPPGDDYEDNWSKRSHLLVSMSPEITNDSRMPITTVLTSRKSTL